MRSTARGRSLRLAAIAALFAGGARGVRRRQGCRRRRWQQRRRRWRAGQDDADDLGSGDGVRGRRLHRGARRLHRGVRRQDRLHGVARLRDPDPRRRRGRRPARHRRHPAARPGAGPRRQDHARARARPRRPRQGVQRLRPRARHRRRRRARRPEQGGREERRVVLAQGLQGEGLRHPEDVGRAHEAAGRDEGRRHRAVVRRDRVRRRHRGGR